MQKKRSRPLTQEDMERVVMMLPKSVVTELDEVATAEGLSRSAMLRTLVIRYLRERPKG